MTMTVNAVTLKVSISPMHKD